MDTIMVTKVFSILGFIIGLVAILVVYGIIKRTKDAIRDGFVFVLMGIGTFVVFEATKVMEMFLIIPQTSAADVFAVVFVVFIMAGMWKLKTLIMGLSDFGRGVPKNKQRSSNDSTRPNQVWTGNSVVLA